ncbi:hypothetical protein [Escherichia coli]|uniref:hypothetical protein n=1 Tax=Escherichia coli TaxID=562 RepID=UPI000B046634|nr:hypothetical protein [Escherichia coli]
MCHSVTGKFEVNNGVNLPDQMVFRNQFVEGNGFKLVLLWGGLSEYGGQSVFILTLLDQSPD